MAENKTGKGLFGAFQGMVDSVKTTVQDIKLPDIKLPEVNIPKIFQKQEEKKDIIEVVPEIKSISVQSAIKIIYFMMNVDGMIQEEEERRFDEIGKELDPDFGAKKEAIVALCQNHMSKIIDPDDYYAVLQDGVEDAIAVGKNPKEAALAPKVLIWDLLTVAYSDGQYDENERKILKYIVRKLNVDKAVFLEMESSYLALRDLEDELNWIKTTDRPYLTIESMVNEIADRKNAIVESVKDLIAY